MRKVVVVYPNLTSAYGLEAKEFETACEEEYLEANNTEQGCLVVLCKADLPKYQPVTLAVFKEWIYWERKEEADPYQEYKDIPDELTPDKEAEKRIIEKK